MWYHVMVVGQRPEDFGLTPTCKSFMLSPIAPQKELALLLQTDGDNWQNNLGIGRAKNNSLLIFMSAKFEIIDTLKQRQHSAGAKQLHLTSNENKRVKNNDSLPKGKEQFVKFQDCHASKTFI